MAYNKQIALTSNILAIQTAIQLRREHRKPTDYEKMILQGYKGFGGLKCVLDTNPVEQWPKSEQHLYPFVQQLWQLLRNEASSPEEAERWIEGVKSSVLTAFYTDNYLINKMGIAIASAMGSDLKRFLDPSTGTGRFLHMFDEAGVQGIAMTAVEQDPLTGFIAQALNPDAEVRIEGFEQFPADQLGTFDLVASNIPFGQVRVFDPLFDKGDEVRRMAQNKIHNYFFLKGLDSLREGGLLFFITSAGVLNSPSNEPIRRYLMEHANLIEALPLPTDLFKEESGIEVDSMFVVLQKNANKKELSQREQWFIETQEVDYEKVERELEEVGYNRGDIRVAYRCPNRYVHERICELADTKFENQHFWMSPSVDTDSYGKPCIHYLNYTYDEVVGLDPGEESGYTQIIRLAMESHYDPSLGREVVVTEAPAVKNVLGGELLSLHDLFGMTDAARESVKRTGRGKRSRKVATPVVTGPKPVVHIPVDTTVYDGHVSEGLLMIAQDQVGAFTLMQGQAMIQLIAMQPGMEDVLRAYVGLRDAYWQLDDMERHTLMIQPDLREALNRVYDDFVERFGALHQPANVSLLGIDPAWKEVFGLERMEAGQAVKADIFREPIAFQWQEPTAMTAQEALASCLNLYGQVNPDYLSERTGRAWEEVRQELWDQVFWKWDGTWVTKAQLQQGNGYEVVDQLALAYVEEDKAEEITHSIEAVREAIPKEIPFEEIGISMGERWIEPSVYERFIQDLLGCRAKVVYDQSIDQYAVIVSGVSYAKAELWSVGAGYGVSDLIVNALMDTYPTIKMSVGYGKERKQVVDAERTQMLATKITDLRNLFSEWLGKLPVADRDRLAQLYNRRFNGIMKTHFDGSFQTFPDLRFDQFPYKDLYPSQKDAIWMIKQQQGGICDHEVGAGKTMIMCVAAHEMKRLGIVNKPMIIALKANVHDIADTYRRAYPDAKILYPGKEDFAPAKRLELFMQIKNNNWDCIILTHNQFQQIPQSLNMELRLLREERDAVDASIEQMKDAEYGIKRIVLKRLEARQRSVVANMRRVMSNIRERADNVIDFHDMGIDHIFVDESHHFKNLGFSSRHTRVAGLGNQQGSQQAFNLLMAIRDIQRRKDSDMGATFLSGTTISNSLTELYNLFRYLRPKALMRQRINSIDSWLAVYAKKSSEYEFSVTNSIIQKERFRQFMKVPELAAFYNQVTDFRTAQMIGIERPSQHTVFLPIAPSEVQKRFTQSLVAFAKTGNAELLGREPLTEKEMSAKMLIATNYAKKMAIDMRLIDPEAYADERGGKVFVCAEKVGEYYRKYDEWKGTQFVFCDIGTYGSTGFDLYSELKRLLVEEQGIPEDEIKFIQQCSTEKAKKKLISDMNEGKLRVVVGSTQMLGTGINAQERAVAVHHLDIPWRPSDLEQRNGRAVRKGNWVAKEHANNQVDVLIYATECTLDAYKFNLLQNKQQFINQLKEGEYGGRTMDEGAMDEDTGMSFAEYVAILSGNTDLLEKAKLDKVINRLEKEKVLYNKQTADLERSLVYDEGQIVEIKGLIKDMQADYELFNSQPATGFKVLTGEVLSGNELGRYMRQYRTNPQLEVSERVTMGYMRGFEYYVNIHPLGNTYGIVGKVSGRSYRTQGAMPRSYDEILPWLEDMGLDLTKRMKSEEFSLRRLEKAVAELKEIIPNRHWPKEAELAEQKQKANVLDIRIKATLHSTEEKDPRLVVVATPKIVEGEDGMIYIQALVDGEPKEAKVLQSLGNALLSNDLTDVARKALVWYNPEYLGQQAGEEHLKTYLSQFFYVPFTIEINGEVVAADHGYVTQENGNEKAQFKVCTVDHKYCSVPLSYELKNRIQTLENSYYTVERYRAAKAKWDEQHSRMNNR